MTMLLLERFSIEAPHHRSCLWLARITPTPTRPHRGGGGAPPGPPPLMGGWEGVSTPMQFARKPF
jgi:hypothetical protein